MPTQKPGPSVLTLLLCAAIAAGAVCLAGCTPGSSSSGQVPPVLLSKPSPTPTASPTPTRTPSPSATSTPAHLPYTIHLTGLDVPAMREVYLLGQQKGKDRHVFTKVGDSEAWRWHYLQPFDEDRYDLGEYGYLQGVVDHFKGSFKALGQTVHPGFPAAANLDPTLANPQFCDQDETPLACEYRTARPSIALITVRTWDYSELGSKFDEALGAIISYSLQEGVIPVVSTVPHQYYPWGKTEEVNHVIRAVAAEHHVPLWDLVLTTDTLPAFGVTANNNHLSMPPDDEAGYLIPDYMQYGIVRHNLESIEVLHILLTQVMTGE